MAIFRFEFTDNTENMHIVYQFEDPETMPQIVLRFSNFLKAVGHSTKKIEIDGTSVDKLDW